jgi:virulence-associated protein VapD
VDYQKDLMQDFIAEVMEKVGEDEEYDMDVIKAHFEVALQNLNTKLKAFADKVRDVDFFEIK